MQVYAMTFKNSLYISITIHLLIFGSAIAFAQFGGGSFLHSRDAVMVLLVSTGPGSGKGDASHARQLPSPQKDEPLAREPEPQTDHATLIPSNNATAIGGAGKIDDASSGTTNSAARTADGQGLVSHEEWAVLVAAIDRSKSYPRLAREHGIEGVVRLRFKLGASGSVDKIELIESSGYEILDDASIRAVYRAAPLPYVKGWVEVPIAYVLK